MAFQIRMTDRNELLLPFCKDCGNYKGVGPCNRCIANMSENEKQKQIRPCIVCGEKMLISCQICKTGYCDEHSENCRESKFMGLDHHIGTCAICGAIICERCWIVVNGIIQCVGHLEMMHTDCSDSTWKHL